MQLSNSKNGLSNPKMMLAALATVLALSTSLPTSSAYAASNLMELFQKKREQRQNAQPKAPVQPQVLAPAASAPAAVPQTPTAPVKRVTVKGPQVYDYKTDALVRIDFSKFDLQTTAATAKVSLDPLTVGMPRLSDHHGQKDIAALSFDQSMDYLKQVDVQAEKAIAAAVVDFYSTHQKMIWSADQKVLAKAKDVAALFASADEDGLDPEEYLVTIPADQFDPTHGDERLQKLTNFEIALSARALRYAMDAGEGRIVADRLSGFHDLPRGRVNPNDVLKQLANAADPVAYLQSLHPQSKWYTALKAELATLDTRHDTNMRIPADTLIRPGEESAEIGKIVALIAKQASAGYLEQHRDVLNAHSDSSVYSPELVSAVKDYQKQTGKTPDGVIGRNTVAALQGELTSTKRDRILYAMERLRWLPHDLGERYVFVNSPSYRAQFFDNGAEKLAMNIVVGSRNNQTYFFYNKVQTVVFNPSWGVPRSIILNEMLPKIMGDSNYLSRNGYEVYSNGKPVAASSVNWSNVAAGNSHVGIRQKPSLDNSLGELKILFPNSHDIYMHDTPAKSYFQRDMRALSHGCIRLERPRDMAAAVLGKSVDDLNPYFGKNERGIKVPDPMPVYIAYFTAWLDAKTEQVRYYDDIYGRDEGLAKAFSKTRASRLAAS